MKMITSAKALEKGCNGPWLDTATNEFLIIAGDYTNVRIPNLYCSAEDIPVSSGYGLETFHFQCRIENRACEDRNFWDQMYDEYVRLKQQENQD